MTDTAARPLRLPLVVALLVAVTAGCAGRAPLPTGPPPPAAGWRGVHVINYESDGDLEGLARDVPALAAEGVNLLILEVDYNFAFVSHPELRRGPSPITPDGARRLVDVCRVNGVRLIPEFQSLGHQS
jgi:hypothetical protein